MVMLQRWSFNGGKMVLLQLVSVGRENGYVTELTSLMD